MEIRCGKQLLPFFFFPSSSFSPSLPSFPRTGGKQEPREYPAFYKLPSFSKSFHFRLIYSPQPPKAVVNDNGNLAYLVDEETEG